MKILAKLRKYVVNFVIMKERFVKSISFPQKDVYELALKRSEELGCRSFSEYVNQLVRYDLGLPNYICDFIQKGDKKAAEKLISKLPPSKQKRNS